MDTRVCRYWIRPPILDIDQYQSKSEGIIWDLCHLPPFLKILDGLYGIIITVIYVQIAHKNRVGKKNDFFCVFR